MPLQRLLIDRARFRALAPEDDLHQALEVPDGWQPAQLPGCVHLDLLRNGQIPDPFFGLNEAAVQWIGERDWLYDCTFELSAEQLAQPYVELCFEGLDTFAEVYLNGAHILSSQNMFVPQRAAAKAHLRAGENRLAVRFESALRRGKALEAQHGVRAVWNGDPSRVYVRKAQYHYGWDWGPRLLTAGIWRPLYVEAYQARIAELHVQPSLSDDLARADLLVQAHIQGEAESARLTLYDPSGALIESVQVAPLDSAVRHTFTLKAPRLWYPHGYGAQARYRVVAELIGARGVLDRRDVRLGLRKVRLVQAPLADQAGTSFYFEINNVPIFCSGANWIPADSFTPRLTATRYHEWLKLAVEANMLMLRVWGGGIYEDEAFYELCDELGVLIWQDFMFACGMYPAYSEFLENVRAEALAQLKRLRHYACIVLWCGNNEDYQIAESLQAYDPDFSGAFAQTAFPAREIYERLLPKLCAEHDPTRPYWPGSPYGGKSVMDQTVGDRHTWEIWHGNMADYQDYARYSGRFISEFGMQALPILPTLEAFTAPEERTLESAALRYHNKASEGFMRLNHYLTRNVGLADALPEYAYLTQLVQAEAAAAAFESWRLGWREHGKRYIGGALIWQLNDCYPAISWALVDYYLRPKPAYYRVKRALAPLALILSAEGPKVTCWAVSQRLQLLEATLQLDCWSLDGELRDQIRAVVPIGANGATLLLTHSAPSAELCVWSARLWQGEQIVARTARFPEPLHSVDYSAARLTVTALGEGRYRLSTDRPVRGVWLEAEDADGRWDDNLLDLLPDEPREICLTVGVGGVRRVRWYGGFAQM
ncbi:MAG: beta-mannosidase [Candidatus Thermofonsia Clade 1 bacterium]|uniref:Beta-mannosidase B n=1 Tax=Candidatus Thermofonsia Clade 1 bacterium TaxID=2364210 RepID=A0A2M8Q0I3_9CHLR|nr:MAG: beta-mannosidase [Candidatus Thermofonsia Clade 1 bacterium]